MPFMVGPAPIRRTLKYLESGKVLFREAVKIFSANVNDSDAQHNGTRDFLFWHLCQIQYKNPNVQCTKLKKLAPTPFIRIYFEDGRNVVIDTSCREKEEILDHLINFTAVCKTQEEINEQEASKKELNSGLFGQAFSRHCMCEIYGQVPCPLMVQLPSSWRGKTNPDIFKPKFKIPPKYIIKGLEDE